MVWYTVCHQLSVFLLFCCVFLSFLKHWCNLKWIPGHDAFREGLFQMKSMCTKFQVSMFQRKSVFFENFNPHPWLEIHFFPITFRKRLWLRMFKSKTASLSVQAKAGHGHLQLVQQWGLHPTELIPFWFLGPRVDLILTKNFWDKRSSSCFLVITEKINNCNNRYSYYTWFSGATG